MAVDTLNIAETIFADCFEDAFNPLIEKAVNAGGIPIGYTCSMVPAELLSVPPLFPVRVNAPGAGSTESADIYLSNLTCSYIRSIMEYALDSKYSFIKGWVNTAGCDHLRRFHDNMAYVLKPEFMHILDVPHRTGPEALAWFADEINNLKNILEKHFKMRIEEDDLLRAIRQRNSIKEILLSISALRKKEDPPLTGEAFHRMLCAASFCPGPVIENELRDLHEALSSAPGIRGGRPKLMIAGGQLDDPSYIGLIESAGALVAADWICTGSATGLHPVEISGTASESMARHYLKSCTCPRMMEGFEERLAVIKKTADEYGVDGVIIQTIKFCDTWGIEAAALAKSLKDAGFRVLRIEREYRRCGEAQLRTRVQAFIESLGGKR